MRPAELREILASDESNAAISGTDHLLDLLADLWEAAEKMRLERFHSVPGKGESEMNSVLRRLGDL